MAKITYETLQPKTGVTYIPHDKCITFGDMLNILNGVNNENTKWLTVSFSNPSNYYMDMFELESSLARINFTENGNSKLNESVGYFPYLKSEQNSLIGRVVATSTNVIVLRTFFYNDSPGGTMEIFTSQTSEDNQMWAIDSNATSVVFLLQEL